MSFAIRVDADDGYPLAARLFPASGEPRAIVAVASAMGVPQRHYAPFAAHLASAGFTALTFDYRGVGGSAPPSLRGFEATLHDWGERDLEGVLAHLERRWPSLPRLLVAHSVGGQVAGLAPRAAALSGLLFVASSSGYWGHWRGRRQAAMLASWYLALPLATRLLGFAPMRRTLGGEDLPAGVAAEWGRWGRRPDYVLSYAKGRAGACYDRIRAPLRAYAFTDDGYAPEPGVRAMVAAYPAARAEVRVVSPSEAGAPVGHFGFFRLRFRPTLWREAVEFLGRVRPTP